MRFALFAAFTTTAACMLAACAQGSSLSDADDGAPPAGDDAAVVQAPASARDAEHDPEHDPEHDAAATTDAATMPPARDASVAVDASIVRDAAAEDATTGAARRPTAGDLVISEIAYDPAGAEPDGEWFEVVNVSPTPVDLRGLVVRDGAARTHTIGSPLIVPPGAFVVLARSTSASVAAGVPASAIAYEYGAGASSQSGVILANGATGSIEIASGSTIVARVPYGTFGLPASAGSLEVRLVAYEASPRATSYCVAPAPTPGAKPACP